MAYLDPQGLTCPGCGKRAEVIWVVGEGPNTRPGEGPAYVSLHQAGPWIEAAEETHPFWTGRLICPDCGASVLQRPARPKE